MLLFFLKGLRYTFYAHKPYAADAVPTGWRIPRKIVMKYRRDRYATALEKSNREPANRAGHGRKGILALPFSHVIQHDDGSSPRGFPAMQPPGGSRVRKDD